MADPALSRGAGGEGAATGSTAEVAAVVPLRAWWRGLPMVVLLVGAVAFGSLAVLCRVLAGENEQRLLQEQTNQAGAVLGVSIGQVRAPLDGAARSAAATSGDPATFARVASSLLTDEGGFSSVVLYGPTSTRPVAAVGADPQLTAGGTGDVARVLAAARRNPFVVVDLLGRRTLGYAVADADRSGYVVYGERPLSPDPNVRRRRDEPFSQLEYALYLGNREDHEHLLNSSLRDLPVSGRRASTVIPFGDQQILLVTRPIDRLGGRLMSDLWWIVLVGGAIGTALLVLLLRRLQRIQAQAVVLAEDNERKHREQREIAETLQRGLLPERLEAPPGAVLAARYWPADDANLVGGDFYDAFRIDEDRWGIAIGDVCGKGIEAAALTGLVRHTLRTAARTSVSPAGALRAVHTAMRDHRPATFCTVCFAVYRATGGADGAAAGSELVIALGGHPRPLLARGDEVVPVGRTGTVLGMLEPDVSDERVELAPGDALVLFTDGLTDAPPSQRLSPDEIADVVRGSGTADPDVLTNDIGARARERRPAGSGDDTAILVVRFGEAVPAPAAATGAAPHTVAAGRSAEPTSA